MLLIIDVQNDFAMPNGSLYVKGGEEIIAPINERIKTGNYDMIVASMDNHPVGHCSFASTHNKNVYDVIKLDTGIEQMMWPDHCVQSTWGNQYAEGLDTSKINIVINKGVDAKVDSYSAIKDNNGEDGKTTGLDNLIREYFILGAINDTYEIDIVGLAYDFCVSWTAKDISNILFEYNHVKINVIKDLTRSVFPENDIKITNELDALAINVI